jgi:hypothetical protein
LVENSVATMVVPWDERMVFLLVERSERKTVDEKVVR